MRPTSPVAPWPVAGGVADHCSLEDAAPHRRGLVAVLAATLIMAMGFGGLSLISVFMRPLEATFGWARADTSFGYALSTIGMAVGGVVWGWVSDRIDPRIPLLTGSAGMVLSLVITSAVQSLLFFYLAQLMYGAFGFSVLYATIVSTSSAQFPQRRGLVMGVITAGGALGQGLLPFFASRLTDAFGWRLAYLGVAAMMLLIFAVTIPWISHSIERNSVVTPCGISSGEKHDEKWALTFLVIAAFLCCTCMAVPIVHMVNYVGSSCGTAQAGINSLVIAMVAGAIGRLLLGSLADNLGPLNSYACASAVQTACVAAFPFAETQFTLLALSAAFGFGSAANMTCLLLCVRMAVPITRFGSAIGVAMAAAWCGMAFGGFMGGVFFDLTLSYKAAFLFAAGAGIMNLAVLWKLGTSRYLMA